MHSIRLARPTDAEAVRAIYAPFVRGSRTSFEQQVPDATALRGRMAAVEASGLPWLVATRDSAVIGYAYAVPHRERAAYAWSVETSVYLEQSTHGRGLGTALMQAVLALLGDQGYGSALAGVALPNPGSVALHRKLGFETVGTYRNVGFKNGTWADVWWGQRMLDACRAPEPPRPLRSLPEESLQTAGIAPTRGVSQG